MPSESTSKVIAAAAFAARKHCDQRRKDERKTPYINHPLALAEVLANEAGVTDTVVLCAALLHDTIEDTQTSAEELVATFGAAITGVVLEVTDDRRLLKQQRKLEQIRHAAHISERAKLVKLADKICNLRDIDGSPPAGWGSARKREYFDWAKAVVDQLRGAHPRLAELFDAAYARRPPEISCAS